MHGLVLTEHELNNGEAFGIAYAQSSEGVHTWLDSATFI
jgi:hypothetical protein